MVVANEFFRWPKEQTVNINNKDYLIEHLVQYELLVSRRNGID